MAERDTPAAQCTSTLPAQPHGTGVNQGGSNRCEVWVVLLLEAGAVVLGSCLHLHARCMLLAVEGHIKGYCWLQGRLLLL